MTNPMVKRAQAELIKANKLIAMASECAADLPVELKVLLNGAIMQRIKIREEALNRAIMASNRRPEDEPVWSDRPAAVEPPLPFC